VHDLDEITTDRRDELLQELLIAIDRTSVEDLSGWGKRTGYVLVGSASRRVNNIATAATAVGKVIQEELFLVLAVATKNRWSDYAALRKNTVSTAVNKAYEKSRSIAQKLKTYSLNDPSAAARDFAAFVIGFYVGSGGVDGDGGVPDLDLVMGIGEHRSIFTHSIIAGVAIETLIVSFVDLVSTIHVNLPERHSSLWDRIQTNTLDIGDLLGRGVSTGIAYHLVVDATIDGAGTYVDLPSMPQEGHQIIGAANAVVEAVDAAKRPKLNYGDIVARYATFGEAAAHAKSGGPFKINRSASGSGFDIIYVPKRL